MRHINFLTVSLAVLITILEVVIYVLFEFQNAWPYNESMFSMLKLISLSGIALSAFFSVIYPRPYVGLLSLVISIFLVTLLSRSGVNPTSLVANLVAIFLIFLSARKLALLRGGHVGMSVS